MLLRKIRNKIARKYYTSCYKERVVLSRYRDLTLLLRPSNNLDRWLKRGLDFERDQLDFCLSVIDSERIEWFVDVGANLGLYSLALAKRAARLERVIAVEPQLENFNQFCGNIYLNQLDRKIEAHHIGCSDRKRELAFLRSAGSSTGTSRVLETAPPSTKFHRFEEDSIQVDTLDNLLAGVKGHRLLLKIDVEGHELKTLAGASNTLRDNFCILQIELLTEEAERISAICEEHSLTHYHQIGSDLYFKSASRA